MIIQQLVCLIFDAIVLVVERVVKPIGPLLGGMIAEYVSVGFVIWDEAVEVPRMVSALNVKSAAFGALVNVRVRMKQVAPDNGVN